MSESLNFIIDRATKTLAAARQLQPDWTWQEKTIPQQEAQLTAITGDAAATPAVTGQQTITANFEQVMLASRGAWDAQLDILHRRTVQGTAMARTRFRTDPAKAPLLARLSAHGSSRREILAEALEWEAAWDKLDKTWAPLPANTLAAFRTLRQHCTEDFQTAYADARAAWREQAEKLGAMAAELEDTNVAWYADATAVFPEGTAEGDMIRGTIPTTYTPPPAPPPGGGGTPPTP